MEAQLRRKGEDIVPSTNADIERSERKTSKKKQRGGGNSEIRGKKKAEKIDLFKRRVSCRSVSANKARKSRFTKVVRNIFL